REEIATIVVCEDDDATLDLLCEHLMADRYEVLPAPSATDALRLCRYNHPDLMLLDLALPDASGLDVLREIRGSDGVDARFNPHLPIIVLTGRGATIDRVRGLDLGADDYVQKPFSYDELRARIEAVLRRRHSRRDGPVRVGEILIDASQSHGRRPRGPPGEERVHADARPRLRPHARLQQGRTAARRLGFQGARR